MLKFLERFTATVKPIDNKKLARLAKKNKISKAKVVRRMVEHALSNPDVMSELFEKV